MDGSITGGCRCGAVRYRVAAAHPLPTYCCHCLDCQKTTGSAFAEQIMLLTSAFSFEGEIVEYSHPRPSGGTSTRANCATCHSPLWTRSSPRPGMIIIRGGTLDDPAPVDPVAHMWASRKRSWIAIPDRVPVYTQTPPTEEFVALLLQPRSRA